jgi:uncharacterized SAM-binding protein YcdF (DUF218 family)
MAAVQLSRALRRLARVLSFTALVLLLASMAACPFAGRYLIIDTPLDKADALVVLAGGNTGRWLEAADLYREGYARHLLLSPGYPDPVGDQLRRDGIRYPSEAEVMRDVYSQLGVPASAIEIMPAGFDNTADEAAGARRMALERGWTSVVVVTAKYHTRRALYAFEREFAGSGITVQVRGSRHEHPQPDGWWRNRSDLRWVLSETQRLVAYRLGLGR